MTATRAAVARLTNERDDLARVVAPDVVEKRGAFDDYAIRDTREGIGDEMKFMITFKDPDTVADAVNEAAKEALESVDGIDDDEREVLVEKRAEKLREAIEPWIEYGEYVRIEFDTEAGTATVFKAPS